MSVKDSFPDGTVFEAHAGLTSFPGRGEIELAHRRRKDRRSARKVDRQPVRLRSNDAPVAEVALGASTRIRLVTAAALNALGAATFVAADRFLASPPAAVLSTAKQGDVAGIEAGRIEISSSTRKSLKLDFALEMHLTGSHREAYVLEVRAPKTGYVDCGTDCEADPLIVQLAFSGSADGSNFDIATRDLSGGPDPLVRAAFTSSTGATATMLEDESPTSHDDRGFPSTSGASVVQLEFLETLFITHPADAGWTVPVARITVAVDEDNAAQSGPYFAVQAPSVATTGSNTSLIAFTPFALNGTVVLGAIPDFSGLMGVVDETGAAILTGGLESESTWRINPGLLTEGFGPVVSYVDHRLLQKAEFWRQGLAPGLGDIGRGVLWRRRGIGPQPTPGSSPIDG
ncbi:hypothetical protein [Herbiconiux daphne]|uniref:Uncharacterized protein n=1 Tax=Herbiconiux daphne TaxID=2970914 RepID=A0ABT2GXI3_9MICO|nr:hypothetical protein [Herbiconiux daphne]MCS5732669.1 hypothetical protein [Herbiconiux daphne]